MTAREGACATRHGLNQRFAKQMRLGAARGRGDKDVAQAAELLLRDPAE